MTHGEIRALLRRVNARRLREASGISSHTVRRALGVTKQDLYRWESGRSVPESAGGLRWVRVIAGLERHARVSAEIAATKRQEAA